MAFTKHPDPALCIPVFIVVDGKPKTNPVYESAPFVVPLEKGIRHRFPITSERIEPQPTKPGGAPFTAIDLAIGSCLIEDPVNGGERKVFLWDGTQFVKPQQRKTG